MLLSDDNANREKATVIGLYAASSIFRRLNFFDLIEIANEDERGTHRTGYFLQLKITSIVSTILKA